MTTRDPIGEFLELPEADADPTIEGQLGYRAGALRFRDSLGVFDPRTGGSGLTPSTHRALDQLVHNIAETSFLEVVRASGKVTDIIYWTTSGKTQKVRETNLTRTSGKVSQIVVKQYDAGGALAETLTGTVTRSSGQVASIDWTLA